MTIHRATYVRPALLAVALLAAVSLLPGCKRTPTAVTPVPVTADGLPVDLKRETADQFVARVNDEYRAMYPEMTAAQWLSSTYIGNDSQLLAAKANERFGTQLKAWIAQSHRFDGKKLSPETARAIMLLKIGTAMPPPNDPAKLAELSRIATRMEGAYGEGTYCSTPGDPSTCRQLGQLEDVLRNSRDYDAQLDAWQGWHDQAKPMAQDYARFVALVNTGARDMGFADAGEMWRSGYDMSPVELAAETDRLWGEVKPLYEQLHCYARTRLEARYPGRGSVSGGLLPAHLMGNMWQQDWGNLWDVLQPYSDRQAGSLDVTGALDRMYRTDYSERLLAQNAEADSDGLGEIERASELETAKQMTLRAQDFYTSLGMPKLPDSYWKNTQFIKPRDREVVCHASAWDMDMAGDVRTKMCIKPDEEDFTTIYHELGHVYYYLAYNKLPPLFQAGAHDGFHEAIGDTMVLSVTPSYLQSIGLVGDQQQSNEALINAQMRMALAKVAFLPFGLMIDRWRWGVFDGSITPANYNSAWWDLKARYQGVAPATPRGNDQFDPGAKYHVAGNTPYTRYFLAHIVQFQFYKAMCEAAGHTGPLNTCSVYGNKAAGAKLEAMLARGASQPWQQTMREMTGSERMDGAALLEYFAPLQAWLVQQNEGKTCGWQAPVAAAPAATAAAATAAPATAAPATSGTATAAPATNAPSVPAPAAPPGKPAPAG